MTKNTKVVAAFPGCGKSWLFDHQADLNQTILDSDSSGFSWSEPGVRNPEFPANYIKHIQENIDKVDAILVSTHQDVRNALKAAGIEYTLVYPDVRCKDIYIQRYKDRGSPEAFIKLLEDKWGAWVEECRDETYPTKISLGNRFIADVWDKICSD